MTTQGWVAGTLVLALGAATAGAQQNVRIVVRDDVGAPVAYALVTLVGGASRVATDSGVAEFRTRAADSLQLSVKRIGHRPLLGWVRRDAGGAYVAHLPRLAQGLASVEVTAAGSATNTPLMQRGFYDRVDRVQRGAILADFFTPEQLDERPFTKVTQMIAGSRHARVIFAGENLRVPVIAGRGGCRMTILLDGQPVTGTAQDGASLEVPQSINPRGTRGGTPGSDGLSIDDVVDGRTVMAIEVYPSTANAPAELVRVSGRGSCGIVALWTGARR